MNKDFPFLDLAKINAKYAPNFKRKYDEFLSKGWYVLGDEVKLFESNFADYCQTNFAVGVSNGLDALSLIIQSLKVMGKLADQDEILVPSNTYIASILPLVNNSIRAIMLDSKSDTFELDYEQIQSKITKKSKAILAVHLYGCPENMGILQEIATNNSLMIIEDAAQAHGATYDNRKVGSFGIASAFSFYPTKNLGCLGDGGAVVTDNSDIANLVKQLRNYGSDKRYEHNFKGFNCRLDEVQAGILNIKLPYLDEENTSRERIADIYLGGIKNRKIVLPMTFSDRKSVWHQFVIESFDRDKLLDVFNKYGIPYDIHYPVPFYKTPAFKELNHSRFENTENHYKKIVSLPMNTALEDNQLMRIIDACNAKY